MIYDNCNNILQTIFPHMPFHISWCLRKEKGYQQLLNILASKANGEHYGFSIFGGVNGLIWNLRKMSFALLHKNCQKRRWIHLIPKWLPCWIWLIHKAILNRRQIDEISSWSPLKMLSTTLLYWFFFLG